MEKKDRKAEEDRNEELMEKYLVDPNVCASLDSTAIIDLFYQLKITVPSKYSNYLEEPILAFNKKRKALLNLAHYILKNNKGTVYGRYAALDLLESALAKNIIYGENINDVLDTNKVTIAKSEYTIATYTYISELIDFEEKDRDLAFFNFISNPSALSEIELQNLFDKFNNHGEYVRATHVQFELFARKGITEESALNLLTDFEKLSPITLQFIDKQFQKQWSNVLTSMKGNDKFSDKYAYFIFNYIDEEQAYQYAQTVTQTKAIKYLLIEYTDRKFGLLEAMKKLLSLEMGVETTYNVMMRKTSDASGEDCLAILKYLDQYQSAALDSIDISAVPGFSYWNDGTVVGGGEQLIALSNRADFFQAMSIYRKYDMGAEADYLEEKYWYNQNLTVAEIEKNVANKSLKSDLAASILLYYGTYCTEDRANGSRNRELLINECIPTLNKAAKYDPSNPYIYKALGDAYSFYGNGTRANEYYNKANNMGADMRDRTSASGKGRSTQTGKRGGKYYINSNGNKTYIKQ